MIGTGHTRTRKIGKKSAVWGHHGNRRSVLMELRGMERDRLRRPRPMMYESFEAMWRAELAKNRTLY